MTITRESMVLMAICFLDLASTLLLLGTRNATEGNPLMAYYLRYGVGMFVLMKVALVVLPIFIAEWSMQFRPHFVKLMLRATIVAYLGIYLVLFLTVNLGIGQSVPHSTTEAPVVQPAR